MRFLACLALLAIAVSAQALAQVQTAPAPWTEAGVMATAVKAGIAVPLVAGTLRKTDLKQWGNEGIDLYAQYETADRAIMGTIFVYPPTLPDIGLTFLATDEAIRRRFGPATHIAEDTLVSIAGVPGAGRRIIYEGVDTGSRVSTALFVRAGSWVVVGRVTGPASRADEIKRNLDALVSRISFPKGSEPLPANSVKTESCQPRGASPSVKIALPEAGEAIALALISAPGVVDEKGHSAINPMRTVPDRLCLETSATLGQIPLLTLLASNTSMLAYSPRMYLLYGDAGIMLELVESREQPGTFYALRHGVGKMYLVGKFQGMPSEGQLHGLILAPDDAPAVVRYQSRLISAKGDEDFNVNCNLTIEGCKGGNGAKK